MRSERRWRSLHESSPRWRHFLNNTLLHVAPNRLWLGFVCSGFVSIFSTRFWLYQRVSMEHRGRDARVPLNTHMERRPHIAYRNSYHSAACVYLYAACGPGCFAPILCLASRYAYLEGTH